MKSEYDFSKAEQGKFYDTDATFHYPIYLETDVDQFLQKIAENKNIDLQILVNELLRNNIKIIQSVQQENFSCFYDFKILMWRSLL